MKLYYKEKYYTLYEGTMQEVLSSMPNNSVDAIITDPPYEISFMGKGWDATGVAYTKETWEHCFRVLKSGGYLLSFGATRTFHRIAVAIEDAGFEIRDTIMWLYGSGFPKSMALDKSIEGKLTIGSANTKDFKKLNGQLVDKTGIGFAKNQFEQGIRPTNYNENGQKRLEKLEPTTDLAKQWQGWGTCLKPAYEPIIVARKPFKGSLVDNVIEYGVGGLNIDECRVETTDKYSYPNGGGGSSFGIGKGIDGTRTTPTESNPLGRFPANVILTYDETDFDEVCGGFPDTKSVSEEKNNKYSFKGNKDAFKWGFKNRVGSGYDDSGSASRYFYCAKASKKDRDEGLDKFETFNGGSYNFRQDGSLDGLIPSKKNIHPTVKPVELMQYLVRLVTPKNGVVLDCFMGSGSTGKAVMFENRERNANYHFIGVEMTSEYLPICHSRIDYALNKYEYDLEKEKQEMEEIGQMSLF
jgi:site-specific DNA-methyltransferase (adenine-specific)